MQCKLKGITLRKAIFEQNIIVFIYRMTVFNYFLVTNIPSRILHLVQLGDGEKAFWTLDAPKGWVETVQQLLSSVTDQINVDFTCLTLIRSIDLD